ncbi:DUF3592 domain-containing protein [Thiohalobacter sp.]|uniref:DUF3592 domain-containing protein n=1 Tax=Thiohalobacter sp. TaxID=2025948 RepID=UPI002628E2F8|nr:DUF3592 domain-containing protein [Thiohalobacter sp.]
MGLLYIFPLVGIFMALRTVLQIRLALASRSWPSTHGELHGINIREVTSREMSTGRRNWMSQHLTAEYTYEVQGRTYRGRRVTMSDGLVKPRKQLLEIIENYEYTRYCRVYYDPGNPERSCLIPGLRMLQFMPLVTAAGFVAFPLVFQSFL